MVKRIIIVLFFLLPLYSVAQMRWDFKLLSLSYGRVIQYENKSSNSVDLVWDRGIRYHDTFPLYYGFGLHYTTNIKFEELGLRGFYNLVSYTFGLSRTFRMFPYILAQGNYKFYISESNPKPVMQPRLGLGINGISLSKNPLAVHTSVQLMYDITKADLTKMQKLTLEVKVGIGISTMRKK